MLHSSAPANSSARRDARRHTSTNLACARPRHASTKLLAGPMPRPNLAGKHPGWREHITKMFEANSNGRNTPNGSEKVVGAAKTMSTFPRPLGTTHLVSCIPGTRTFLLVQVRVLRRQENTWLRPFVLSRRRWLQNQKGSGVIAGAACMIYCIRVSVMMMLRMRARLMRHGKRLRRT